MSDPLLIAVVEPPSLAPILPPLVAGALAIYLLLPRPKPFPRLLGAGVGALALILAGWMLVELGTVSLPGVLFYTFSAIALIAGGLLVTQHNPAYAALSFALVVLSTCGLFLLQAAPFLMASTIIIYAGAIIVTFLFVLMLAQRNGPSDADDRSREPMLASVAGFVLLGALLAVVRLVYDQGVVGPYLDRVHKASQKDSVEEIVEVMGDQFFRELEKDLTRAPRSEEDEDKPAKEDEESPGAPEWKVFRDDLVNGEYPPEQIWRKWVRGRDDKEEGEKKLREGKKAKDAALIKEGNALIKEGETQMAEADLPLRQSLPQLEKDLQRLHAATGSYPPPTLTESNPAMPLTLSPFSGPPANGPLRRDASGEASLPAQNVAGLGRTLFTDFLLAVELAGTLLLIATIGAIIIAHRGGERQS